MGLSLRTLADAIGMTAGYLSRVEREQVSPSLDALQSIAKALQVPMFYFLNSVPADPIVRKGARRILSFPDSKIGYELLTPDLGHQMMSVMIHMEPGARRTTAPLPKPNEQWMFVMEGCLEIDLEGNKYILEKGDSIYFDGNQLQYFSSIGKEELILICNITPPVF
jgi:transcriptional regulator with XRE-family HTH domain